MSKLIEEFSNSLWKKQQMAAKSLNKPHTYNNFEDYSRAYDVIEKGQTVLLRSYDFDLGKFLTVRNKTGDKGKVIMVGEPADFPYKVARSIVGKKLPDDKDYYVKDVKGREEIRECFSTNSIDIFGKKLPFYPSMVVDSSVDHVMIEPVDMFLSSSKKPSVFVEETHKKLKTCGTMTAISSSLDYLNDFSIIVISVRDDKGLNFYETPEDRGFHYKWQKYFKSPAKHN